MKTRTLAPDLVRTIDAKDWTGPKVVDGLPVERPRPRRRVMKAVDMFAARALSGNRLLDALPDDVWARLKPDLVQAEMPANLILHLAHSAVSHAYFPTTAIVSKLYLMEDGSSAGVALVGSEGMVGVSAFLGGVKPPHQAQVLQDGQGWKLPASCLVEEFGRGGPLMNILLGYTQSLLAQTMQTAACNSHGTLQERLCRWLLMNLDRTSDSEIRMTHQSMADALCVRRESISEAAAMLQDQGAIRYRWGRVRVLDRAALERRVCECYRPVRPSSPIANSILSRPRSQAAACVVAASVAA